MTIDHCPHGYYRPWFNGRCPTCHYIPPTRQEPVQRRPRLRDAAMWSAFVHELRAELYLDELARTINYAINMQIVSELNASVRAPHAEHSDRVIAKLRAMSPEELRQTFVDAGIYDESGNMTEPYRE